MQWRWKTFESLSVHELYAILRLRQQVFCVEQKCAYQDVDNWDPKAWHLMGFEKGELVAYLRAFPKNVRYEEVSVGRVVTAPEARRHGYGREVLSRGISLAEEAFGLGPMKIAAQAYLEKFYGTAGFVRVSDEYLEDDIPHIDMLRK